MMTVAEDFRTPGWPAGAVDSCVDWTPEMHRQFACGLLDANAIPSGEDGWNGAPAFRLYESHEDGEGGDVHDTAPFLAAIAHALLAQVIRPGTAGGDDR